MFKFIELVTHWLKRVITQPLQELDRWQMAVRFAYDLGRFGAHQLRQDRAQDMAAALAFRTLFGLLPVLVVATVLVKGMSMQQHFLGPLNELFAFWGLDQVQILLPGETGGATSTLAVWLGDRVREAESVSLAAIGWVGLGLTVYAAISLVVTIEDCFNVIYQAPQGRPWSRRVPLYWFALTISPVVVVASTYVNDWCQVSNWAGVVLGLVYPARAAGIPL
jgi:membrane protein